MLWPILLRTISVKKSFTLKQHLPASQVSHREHVVKSADLARKALCCLFTLSKLCMKTSCTESEATRILNGFISLGFSFYTRILMITLDTTTCPHGPRSKSTVGFKGRICAHSTPCSSPGCALSVLILELSCGHCCIKNIFFKLKNPCSSESPRCNEPGENLI